MSQLGNMWAKFNKQYWKNSLTPIDISIVPESVLQDMAACYYTSPRAIKMADSYIKQKNIKQIEALLRHEMVHQFLFEKYGITEAHGAKFEAEAKRVKAPLNCEMTSGIKQRIRDELGGHPFLYQCSTGHRLATNVELFDSRAKCRQCHRPLSRVRL